jgi:hypothetical protein
MKILLITAAMSALIPAAPPANAPLLLITSVTPRTLNDNSCKVELRNQYARRAIAWVIEHVPDRHSGSGHDFVRNPELALQPGGTTTAAFSCDVGEPIAIEVGAVLYEDGAIGGNASLLGRAILDVRRKHARGLRELTSLLSSGRLVARASRPVVQLQRTR